MRPIAISLSPNLEIDDSLLALKTLFSPWKWIKGDETKKVEQWFKRYFQTPFVFSFDSGRSGEYAILKSLGIGKGDEVLLQAFTCVAVPNSVLWTGATPVYVDVGSSFTLDLSDLEKKITKHTKAVIVQHTFGIAANIDEIKKIAKKYKLPFIEDCAHTLGGSVDGEKLGSFGDGAFFSFGRDKVVSSVFGGIVITKDKKLAKKLEEFEKSLPSPSMFWLLQQLLHPISFAIILPFYQFLHIGKFLLFSLQRLHLLSLPVEDKEKSGQRPSYYPRKFSNCLATLAFHQLKKLERFNAHRIKIANFYAEVLKDVPVVSPRIEKGNILLRFPVLLQSRVSRNKTLEFFRKKGMLVGNWYSNVIDPEGVNFGKIGYAPGGCPRAERLARYVLNLPTYPTLTIIQAEKVVQVLRKSLS